MSRERVRSSGCLAVITLLLTGCGGGGSDEHPEPSAVFIVSGTVSGLPEHGELLLSLNDGLSEPVSSTFTFSDKLEDGDAYHINLASKPSRTECTVENGTGIVNS